MIGEPEMAGEEGGGPPELLGSTVGAGPGTAAYDIAYDVVSDAGTAPPLLRRLGERPWAWALAAAVVTSAVWAGVLQGTGYGRADPPDLHGYRTDGNPCTARNLQPLADDLNGVRFDPGPPTVTESTALDHLACDLTATVTDGDGWWTTYTVSVSVDLHKVTDPAAEFDAVNRTSVRTPPPEAGVAYAVISTEPLTTYPRGIGDRAVLTSEKYRQSLGVRHGGAVFSLTLSGRNDWDIGRGDPPRNPDGSNTRPTFVDTARYAKDLVPAMRRLMAALTKPPAPGS